MYSSQDPSHTLRPALAQIPIIAILRGLSPEETAVRASKLLGLGVRLVEVTVHDESGFGALAEAVHRCAELEGRVGAGSVTSPEDVIRVMKIGAEFILTPGLSSDVVVEARAAGVPILPGVATPSEVQLAAGLGLSTLKLFPASHLGGPSYMQALHGPFPEMDFVPTGGVDLDNAQGYLDGGAIGVGLGSELTRPGGMERLEQWTTGRLGTGRS